jgi:hypothetical protein
VPVAPLLLEEDPVPVAPLLLEKDPVPVAPLLLEEDPVPVAPLLLEEDPVPVAPLGPLSLGPLSHCFSCLTRLACNPCTARYSGPFTAR